jgi:hypothetical protein
MGERDDGLLIFGLSVAQSLWSQSPYCAVQPPVR